jgi:hypothetical protein
MLVRIIAAAAALVSAAVHLRLWFDGFSNDHVVGPAFMVNAVAGATIAVLLVLWRHWVPLFLALGFGASTLGAFLLATTVGFFGTHETWTGPYVWAAAVSEAVVIVAAGLGLLQDPLFSRTELQNRMAVRRPNHH